MKRILSAILFAATAFSAATAQSGYPFTPVPFTAVSVTGVSIAKKESPLSIVGDQLTYGEKPKISMDMAPGDQIASFDYDYDDINKDNPIVTIKDTDLPARASQQCRRSLAAPAVP